jgi:hypothetical protein
MLTAQRRMLKAQSTANAQRVKLNQPAMLNA